MTEQFTRQDRLTARQNYCGVINKNFKLTIQLFEDMFRHDSCHHQLNMFFRFLLFYIRLQFEYVNNLKFKNTITVTILRMQVHEC